MRLASLHGSMKWAKRCHLLLEQAADTAAGQGDHLAHLRLGEGL
jgi:hypothetical protein